MAKTPEEKAQDIVIIDAITDPDNGIIDYALESFKLLQKIEFNTRK